jgi:fucose permease
VKQSGLKALIVWCGAGATAVSLFFPWLESLEMLCALLFLSGIAAGPFWPSIQSDGAQRIRGDYTMMMILFSCAGVPGCGFFTDAIGLLGDLAGLRMSFYIVPACFLIVFFLMGYDMLRDRAKAR